MRANLGAQWKEHLGVADVKIAGAATHKRMTRNASDDSVVHRKMVVGFDPLELSR